MIDGKKVLAIIPARGGSKRLPRKNVLEIAGKPLIAWTIEAAKKSEFVDDVVVSTDCNEIADVSMEYGANIPFLRPEYLSNDTATTNDVVMHTVENHEFGVFDYYIILQPTSPMRTALDINDAIKLITEDDLDGVISVCECEHSPLWSNTLPKNQTLNSFLPNNLEGVRSQELPTYYRLNGSLYLFKHEALVRNKGIFYSDKVKALIMPSERSVDIDNMFDFKIAKALLDESNLDKPFNQNATLGNE